MHDNVTGQVRHGKWIKCSELEDGPYSVGSRCSCCGYWKLTAKWNYCPKCGARMKEDDDDGEMP